jgi:hypothetical protein
VQRKSGEVTKNGQMPDHVEEHAGVLFPDDWRAGQGGGGSEVLELQGKMLIGLVRHAYENVSFYARVLVRTIWNPRSPFVSKESREK